MPKDTVQPTTPLWVTTIPADNKLCATASARADGRVPYSSCSAEPVSGEQRRSSPSMKPAALRSRVGLV